MVATPAKKTPFQYIASTIWIILGAFLAALAIRVFIYPNNLIDGGIIGITLILGRLFGSTYMSYVLVLLTLPFIYLAYKFIRRTFVIQLVIAVVFFAIFLSLTAKIPEFHGEMLEIVVIGGALLGIGSGLIIRHGGCLDGTEILAIIINRKKGFTVGQVVLVINFFIFAAFGFLFRNWHDAFGSLLTYIVAFKMIDLVIVGLDELKSVLIISSKPKDLSEVIMHEMGLGLTIMYGRGGYTGDAREILFVIVERLDLANLKDIVLRTDPNAFMAIENLHEVVYSKGPNIPTKKRGRKKRISS
jgi:uncharacterized membrane-anchored protein YitT (DUF2179 family)